VKGLANHRSSGPPCRAAASACSLLTSMIRPQAVQVSRYFVPTEKSGMKNSENLRLCLLQLEPHHPVGQTAGRHLCYRSGCGVELKQAMARITDDSAGVVGPGDDLDRAGERLVGDGLHLSWIRRRGRRLQVVDGLMHLPTVPIRRAPPGEVRSSPDQREDSVGDVVTVQILASR
jgi:hypothetical protein